MSTETEPDTELAPREDEDSLEELQSRPKLTGAELDPEDFEDVLDIDLLDTPLEELEVKIIPQQPDEFTCTSCYLVLKQHLNSSAPGEPAVCKECLY